MEVRLPSSETKRKAPHAGQQRVEHLAEGVTLYLGDCRDVLPTLPKVDVLVTDPPYGVEFSGTKWDKLGKQRSKRNGSETYVDDEENFRKVILPAVSLALTRADRAAIFSGVRRITEYPQPKDIGGIIYPYSVGRSSWGFSCYNPVLFYGISPYYKLGQIGRQPTVFLTYSAGEIIEVDHPCPKPIKFMMWLVQTASLENEIVLDPFMGSGTTGIAAIALGRKFIGIELEPKYFDIACKRIDAELRKPGFFVQKPKRTPRPAFFAGRKPRV
jgi:site-specific DNA-methyltransferase (adenine-specific)